MNITTQEKMQQCKNRFDWSPIPERLSSSSRESRSERIMFSCSFRLCWLAVAASNWSTTLSRSFYNTRTHRTKLPLRTICYRLSMHRIFVLQPRHVMSTCRQNFTLQALMTHLLLTNILTGIKTVPPWWKYFLLSQMHISECLWICS